MTNNHTPPEITVMTFNVGNGLAPATHLAALLRHSGADLIGLQELDAGQAEAVDRLTRDRYPYQIVRGTGFEGRGSTFPTRPGRIRSVNHRLSWVPLPTFSRFDYIWHTRDLAAERAWVGRRGAGSDHLPVLARLTRNPEPE
jgi:endonuclease/exonuclease/phosphatase (EEP) superfamily protein YafD